MRAGEAGRLAALRTFGSDDASARAVFDRIAELAADLFDAPMGVVTLVEENEVLLKGRFGLDVAAAPRGHLLWPEALDAAAPATVAIADAAADPRTRGHPAVVGEPRVGFYAAAALVTPEGWRIGTVAALDRRPRAAPTPRELRRLSGLAAIVVDALELRSRHRASLDALAADRQAAEDAAKAAQETARAKSDFLADMSHEIRTPLNSIIGFAQVLKRGGAFDDAQLSQVNRVEEAGRSLLGMVDRVLELSRLEAGAVAIERRPFVPARLARDAAALIRPQATEKGLRLVVEASAAADAAVLGDPDRLRQVLLNLLSNAVKFTFAGEVRLRLDADRVGADAAGAGLDLGIAVEDSGIGIAAEQLPNLFRRYAQADGSIGPRFGGTGLGLAISKRLVEAMGGVIGAESTPGVGSRFRVSLVLPLAEAATPEAPVAPGRAAALDRVRLLLADDVPVNRKLVQAMLSPLGCAVDAVGDGAAALAAVQRQDYALVLMDMEMPVLDGPAATRAIRGLGGRFTALPIVALTANVFPEQAARARAAGMDDLVTKPIDSDRLIDTVVRWTIGRGAEPSVDAEPVPAPPR